MSSRSFHDWFSQSLMIENNTVSLVLHDPQDETKDLPILKCDLGQFLNGLAFMFQGKIDADRFIGYFNRIPSDNAFCSKCEHNMLGFDHCSTHECIRRKPAVTSPLQCMFVEDWKGRCTKQTVIGELYCEEHISVHCVSCGAQATHSCDETLQMVCGYPLCDNCVHVYMNGQHRHVKKGLIDQVRQ